CLTLQILQLAFDFADHVVETAHVCFGGAQTKFGFVAALMQACDACRFFQNGAPVERLLADEHADLALPHEGGGACAGRCIGKEYLHVALAHVATVDAIDRPGFALDPARNFDGVVFVISRARRTVRIVDEQSHLGDIACGTTRGAREDHVVHFAAANGSGARFAHHPAQRIEQIRFAATIRPDHGGETGFDEQFRRLHERFEAGKSQPCEFQLCDALAMRIRICRAYFFSTASSSFWRPSQSYWPPCTFPFTMKVGVPVMLYRFWPSSPTRDARSSWVLSCMHLSACSPPMPAMRATDRMPAWTSSGWYSGSQLI